MITTLDQRHSRRTTAVLLIILAIASSTASAQDSLGRRVWSLGASLGPVKASDDIGFRTLGSAPTCCGGYPEGGSGLGLNGAISSRWWPWERSRFVSFTGDLEFAYAASALATRELLGYALAPGGEIVVAESEHFISTDVLIGSLVAGVRIQPLRSISATLSVAVGIGTPLSATYTEREGLVGPAGASFADGDVFDRTRRNVQQGDIAMMSGAVADIRVGVAYDIELSTTWNGMNVILTPEVWLGRSITSMHANADWRRQTLRAGLTAALLRRGPKTVPGPSGRYRIVYTLKDAEADAANVREELVRRGADDVDIERIIVDGRPAYQVQSEAFDSFDDASVAIDNQRDAWLEVIGTRPNLQEVE